MEFNKINGVFHKESMINISFRDKVNILLNKPSKLNQKDVIELMRIKRLRSPTSTKKTYSEYVNNLYTQHYQPITQ